MPPEFDLTDQPFNTSFAPLCALGDALWERGELQSLRQFSAIPAKACAHTPGEKLLDAFLVILAGYPSLCLLNTALRPDPMLAQAWYRSTLADQSSVSCTLVSSKNNFPFCGGAATTGSRQVGLYWASS